MKTLKEAQIILALDFDSEVETLNLVEKLEPALCKLKIGKQLFVREGPKVIKKLKDKGFDVFLDLKFHDIPNTVVKACEAAADMGCWMVTIHASGGIKMMEAVTSSFARLESPPLLVAVTILTSLDGYEMEKAGFSKSIEEHAQILAKLSHKAGVDGVVCSALEIESIKKCVGEQFIYVTPGIRYQADLTQDQNRVVAPKKAILLGSDYLVIGRSITQAADPLSKLKQISLDIQ